MSKVAPVTAVRVMRWTASAAMAARADDASHRQRRAVLAVGRFGRWPMTWVQAHPRLLRHSLASAMAAAKAPACVIAGRLRHADSGTLASRTYIHQLPQTPPRLARLIEDLYGPAARQAPVA
jgi:integrase